LKQSEMTWLASLPWPQIWTAMGWEMTCWVGSHHRCAGVKVVWNEDLLLKQVTARQFFSMTQGVRAALELQLADRFSWVVSPLGFDQPHQLFLYQHSTPREDSK
jgi:hypothetical protein